MKAFNPSELLRTLNRHGVHYIVIGGIAAAIHGGSAETYVLDICYDRSQKNLERLAAALSEMDARPRSSPQPTSALNEETLRNGDAFAFATSFGDFDCFAVPQGSSGYADMLERAATAEFDGGAIRVASIDDLIRMKRAAGRPNDLIAVDLLEAIRQLES